MADFVLPETYAKVTRLTVVVPAPAGVADLVGPDRITVIPGRVELTLCREEGTPRGREWAVVGVVGIRRLKSGGCGGRPIYSGGWHAARPDIWRGDASVTRPAWLTALLAEHLPAGWSPSLVELPTCATCEGPLPADRVAYCSGRCRWADDDHGADESPAGGDE
ncbi:hypothetical protein AB0F42_24280 [Streptomyces buecherae]|uniref:hypothetical protein n=1 Tax=Streptomyces buecherae TaxID=2763006 RepID=UPI0033FC8603